MERPASPSFSIGSPSRKNWPKWPTDLENYRRGFSNVFTDPTLHLYNRWGLNIDWDRQRGFAAAVARDEGDARVWGGWMGRLGPLPAPQTTKALVWRA